MLKEDFPNVLEYPQQQGMQHFGRRCSMNAAIVCLVEPDAVEGVPDALLTDLLQTVQIIPINKPFNLLLSLQLVLCSRIVCICSRTMTISTQLSSITRPNKILTTE